MDWEVWCTKLSPGDSLAHQTVPRGQQTVTILAASQSMWCPSDQQWSAILSSGCFWTQPCSLQPRMWPTPSPSLLNSLLDNSCMECGHLCLPLVVCWKALAQRGEEPLAFVQYPLMIAIVCYSLWRGHCLRKDEGHLV